MTESTVKQLHVLVYGGPERDDDLTGWIGTHAQIEYVDSFQAALDALGERPIDIVICRASHFGNLASAPLSSEASAIINQLDLGIGVFDEKGKVVWANQDLQSLPEKIRGEIRRCCRDTFAWAKATASAGSSAVRGQRFNFATARKKSFEVIATPIIVRGNVEQVAAVVRKTRGGRRLQDRIDAIDQAGRELLCLDIEQLSRLDMNDRLSLLEQKVFRCAADLLRYDNFMVFVLNKHTNMLQPALVYGMPADRADIELPATTDGGGICGFVATRGRSYICPDASKDPRYIRGIHDAKSSLTVPLTLHDEVAGVLNFESTKLAHFTEDDRQTAEILARYIALALHILELMVSERQQTAGRLQKDVLANITGPVNDILTEAETLVEEYIGHDDLRAKLNSISANAVKIRDALNDLAASAKTGMFGARPAGQHTRDPLLAGKRVLLADDEEIIRKTVRDVLQGYGCDVSAVDEGGAAIDLVRSQAFDLVLSDIRMPNKNGYEVFAATKEANPTTPVILTTGFGYDPNHSIVRARREGLTAVLFKPFKVDQLLAEIRTALQAVQS